MTASTRQARTPAVRPMSSEDTCKARLSIGEAVMVHRASRYVWSNLTKHVSQWGFEGVNGGVNGVEPR